MLELEEMVVLAGWVLEELEWVALELVVDSVDEAVMCVLFCCNVCI